MRGIGRGVAGRITLAERRRCFPWMFKREEKATPRPRFPPRTWGTLHVSVPQEDCAVADSDRLLKMHNQEGLSGPPGLSELRLRKWLHLHQRIGSSRRRADTRARFLIGSPHPR